LIVFGGHKSTFFAAEDSQVVDGKKRVVSKFRNPQSPSPKPNFLHSPNIAIKSHVSQICEKYTKVRIVKTDVNV
jgi:hypothetical protein